MHSSAKNRRLPGLWNNYISMAGIIIAVVCTAIGLPMMILDITRGHSNAYLGALIYLVFPTIGGGGVALILIGIALEWRRRKKHPGLQPHPWPVIDMNRPQHQLTMAGIVIASLVAAALLGVTGYRGYHFTESVEFCGTTCHTVMEPEHTTYMKSPHARVACVECHVGPGASWYVRSKLSGLYQVYAVAADKYPRPVPTPIEHLRPAQETCEQCHWPSKFFGAHLLSYNHTLPDETNSPWEIQMLVKVGGGDTRKGAPEGIHWHMNINNEIQYIATDEKRQVIPWVRSTNATGEVTTYVSTENPPTEEQLAGAEIRRMDCVDCHNRPAHIFLSPDIALDQAFSQGLVDRGLPFLKEQAVALLTAEYATKEEALGKIESGLRAYYGEEYPEIASGNAAALAQAIKTVQDIYAQNFFPRMNADWRAYTNNIGHIASDGCFRCHDGQHVSDSGKTITNDCYACHEFIQQGPPGAPVASGLEHQEFVHPVDLGMDVTEFKCTECHAE